MSESNGHNAPRMAMLSDTNEEEGKVSNQSEAVNKIEDALNLCMSNLNKLSFPLSNSATLKRRIDDALEALNTHREAWQAPSRKEVLIEERMRALEETVKKSLEVSSRNSASIAPSQGSKPSYATVAAAAPAKTAVRIRVSGAEKMQPEQLLSLAKQHIHGAYAVKQMRSHDTEVYVQSSVQRDAALNMPQPDSFKVLKQDYPVEVMGVPLGLAIQGGKNACNNSLISSIVQATRVRIPGLQINRIRWLHNGKEHNWAKKNGHTRGSIIICLPTEELQKEVVRHGLVLDAILYTAQLWSPKARAVLCFNCNQWGHTQAACGKPARCGECAGAHQTRDCPKQSVSCCNCGKPHRAWQKTACQTYQIYKGYVERVRKDLIEKTSEARREKSLGIVAVDNPDGKSDDGFTLVTSKTIEPKRGPGRPRKIPIDLTRSSIDIGISEQVEPQNRPTRGTSKVRSQNEVVGNPSSRRL